MTGQWTAYEKIEQALADDATLLDLSNLSLATVPDAITQLKNLQVLYLSHNQLTTVPGKLGELSKLRTLKLNGNRLTTVPKRLGDLKKLRSLYLNHNELTSIPAQIGQLVELRTLKLNGNRLKVVPEELGYLKNLEILYIQNNELTAVPEHIGQIENLQTLYLNYNRLKSIPKQLGELKKLQSISLTQNLLPNALMAAFERGLDDLWTYLRSATEEEAELLYEAKLVLVGDGGVGKSSLLAALKSLPFVPDRKTTHGIDIVELPLPHPDAGVLVEAATEPEIAEGTEISIRAWDFGGQPEYRVTHQFFYSERTLYVLVWNSRLELEAQNSRIEHWLKHIRRRVGQNIRVLVVASHCQAESNDRTPNVDQYGLQTRHSGIIAGFHNIDSETGYGVDGVRQAIAREAARLPQMGDPLPPSWKAARDEVLSEDGPLMFHDEFVKVCKSHELTDPETETLSALMNDLGQIIHFRDDPTLRGVVVRQPDWLSKAIGLVIDDKATIDSNGILDHGRLEEIWNNPERNDSERYTNSLLYPYFLKLMHEFDVSYGIDHDSSLIAQLISTEKPGDRLPWEHHDDPPAGQHRRQLVVDIQDDPPGLMPWLIVRNHRFIKEPIHWSQGVFLESDEFGQALVELIDRRLLLTVRHSYPPTFMAMLQGSVTEVLKKWKGLAGKYRFKVPCQTVHEDGSRCDGLLDLTALQKSRGKRTDYPCDTCYEDQPIAKLLDGIAPPTQDEKLAVVIRKLDEAQEERQQYFEMAEETRRYHAAEVAGFVQILLNALDNPQDPCPRLFTMMPDSWDGESYTDWLKRLGTEAWRMTLWCEMPGHQHPTCPIGSTGANGDPSTGEYLIRQPKDWLNQFTKITGLVSKTMGVLAPVSKVLAGAAIGESDELKLALKRIDAMKTFCAQLPKNRSIAADPHLFELNPDDDRQHSFRQMADGEHLHQLFTLLKSVDPEKKFKQTLIRTLDKSSGTHLWLCREHFDMLRGPV